MYLEIYHSNKDLSLRASLEKPPNPLTYGERIDGVKKASRRFGATEEKKKRERVACHRY